MQKMLGILIGIAIVAVAIFIGAMIGTMGGAFTGWVISKTCFGDWASAAVTSLTGRTVSLVDLGLLLGFVGAFFPSRQTKGDR